MTWVAEIAMDEEEDPTTTTTPTFTQWSPIPSHPDLVAMVVVRSSSTRSNSSHSSHSTSSNNTSSSTSSSSSEVRLYEFKDYGTTCTTRATTRLVARVAVSSSSSSLSSSASASAAARNSAMVSSLDWSQHSHSTHYPCGLLAGGMDDGTVHVWNVAALLKAGVGITSTKTSTSTTIPVLVASNESKDQNSAAENHHLTAAAENHSAIGALLCIVTSPHLENTKVSALQFHPTEPTQLAMGSALGVVVVVADLLLLTDNTNTNTNTSNTKYSIIELAVGQHTQHHGEVTSLAWNRHVPHILASSSTDGSVAIWDVHSKSLWCKLLVEAAGPGVAQTLWHPTQGMLLLTASADDRNPLLKLYDLAVSTTVPYTTLRNHYNHTTGTHENHTHADHPDDHGGNSIPGHSAGIIQCSWCPHDATLLLSCGRDHRVLLWDFMALQPVAELAPEMMDRMETKTKTDDINTTATTNHQHHHYPPVDPMQLFSSSAAAPIISNHRQFHHPHRSLRVSCAWSPIRRGLVRTTSVDHPFQVHCITPLATRTGRVPQWWFRNHCSSTTAAAVSTAFGGLVIYTSTSVAQSESRYHVVVETIPEQLPLTKLAAAFFHSEVGASASSTSSSSSSEAVVEFCRQKQQQQHQQRKQYHHPNPPNRLWGFLAVIVQANAREQLLAHLGYDAQQIAHAAASAAASAAAAAAQNDHQKDSHPAAVMGGTGTAMGIENGVEKLSLRVEEENPRPALLQDTTTVVKNALIVGNVHAAIECCIQAGNWADALLLSYCAGAELWQQTQQRYLVRHPQPYRGLLKGIVQSDWDTLVAESSLASWQETLAILSSYAQSEDFPRLCIALGDRLEVVELYENASLCFVCALSIRRASRFWIRQFHTSSYSSSGRAASKASALTTTFTHALHELVVKATVFLKACSIHEALPDELADLFSLYAQGLAEQGLLVAAARYCQGSATSTMILKDRLYRSRFSQRCVAEMGSPPDFPFAIIQSPPPSQSHSATTATNSQSSQQRTAIQNPAKSKSYHQAQQRQRTEQQAPYPQRRQQQQQQQQRPTVNQPASTSTNAAAPQAALNYAKNTAESNSLDTLPPEWIALHDPSSGLTYYANQTTGETTWDRPVSSSSFVEKSVSFVDTPSTPLKVLDASSTPIAPSTASASKLSVMNNVVFKYGDGFVTSASHPELANQYGNVGTSNPYTGVTRPGTAAAVIGGGQGGDSSNEHAPPSGPVDMDALMLETRHTQIKDTLHALYNHLESNSFPSEKRQLEEAKKGMEILIKKLSKNAIDEAVESKILSMTSSIANQDLRSATAIQMALVNSDWKEHKDWLKGIKILLQLATKKV